MTSHVDPALLEMFAAEVETHMAALGDGLLSLEQNPNQSERFEALMRAAHSIKGAAKLVGLQAAVEVAHVIEDCFVAARAGRLAMTSSLVDVLLEGVDLLGRAAQFDTPLENRVTESQIAATVQKIVQATSAAPASGAVVAPAKESPSTTTPAASAAARQSQATQFRPRGSLDERWTGAIHRDIAAVLNAGETIALDLSDITAIDPLALALLVQIAHGSDATPHSLRLQNVPPRFEPLLRAVGLSAHVVRSAEGS